MNESDFLMNICFVSVVVLCLTAFYFRNMETLIPAAVFSLFQWSILLRKKHEN